MSNLSGLGSPERNANYLWPAACRSYTNFHQNGTIHREYPHVLKLNDSYFEIRNALVLIMFCV